MTLFPAATTNTVLQVAGAGKGAFRTLDLSTAAGVNTGVLIEWNHARDLGNGDTATVELCSTAARTSCTVLASYPGPIVDTVLSSGSATLTRAAAAPSRAPLDTPNVTS